MQQPGPPLEEEAPDWKLEDLVKLALLSEEFPHPATPHVTYLKTLNISQTRIKNFHKTKNADTATPTKFKCMKNTMFRSVNF